MKTVRILLTLALCGAATVSESMWLRAGKAIATRFAAKAYKPMQTFKAIKPVQYKPMTSLARTPLFNGFRSKRAIAGFSLFGAATAAGAASYAYQHKTSQEFDFNKNGTFTVRDIAGTINVEGWDKDRLEIKVSKEAHSQEALDRSLVLIGSTKDNSGILNIHDRQYTVLNPPLIIANGDNDLTINGKPAARIRYDVRAPHSSNLYIRSIAGSIVLKGILGSVDAATDSGNIETTRCNNITAESMSGNISLEQSYGTAKAKSMSGNVSITNNPMALNALLTNALDTKGFTLDEATGSSMSGNVSISGALKGKASSTSGKATLNGQTGSSIWWE